MTLKFENLTLGYDRHPAVHHLTAEIPDSSLTALIGPNGAGKSTLMRAIAGELVPLEGRITRAPGRIAWLPQQAEVDRSFPISVFDFVAMGLWARIGAMRGVARGDARAVEQALTAVGLPGFGPRPIGALSGGQMQRVLFTRLSLQDAGLLLLDEPLTAVDARTANDLLSIIHDWQHEGRTIIAVLHDMEVVRSHFPQTLMLMREKIAHGPTAQVLTPENLRRMRQVSASVDDDAAICERGAA
ncbi:metal ABC transporter ATP-binding protein [Paracoccus sp. p1-h21]|uniref:metal ABC transporter ATP-binding protein n=1 Tax=Paracoccus sp. p1-h21 TaxID=3366951 RepID=UPI00379044DE